MKRAYTSLLTAVLGIAALVLAASCKQDVAASGQTATANAQAKQPVKTSKVAKLVFIGKKNACDCTRARVDGSLAEIQKALTRHSNIAVEQLHVDVDAEAVASYQKLRPIMVLPAIYLLAGSGNLVDVLQGEVTAEQVQKVLGGEGERTDNSDRVVGEER
jgi:hypothetical protein